MNEYTQYTINTVKEKLVGDYEKDMAYLHRCSEKYKNDEDGPEILREIATIMYEILPDSEKNQLDSKLEELKDKVQIEYEAVKERIKEGDFVKARTRMEGILQAEEAIVEDEKTIYLSINHIVELYLYSYYFTPVKEVQTTDVMYHDYYRTYGLILSHLEEYDEAIKAYEKSIKWNPVDLDSFLGMAEIYKYSGNLSEYLKVTKKSYRFCCTRATMARYYRNLGFYYVEKYKPDVAKALYAYSNIYYKSDNADHELQYLEKATGKSTPEYTLAELQQILEENEIELGPDSTTIGIVYRVGQLLMQDGDKERARECFTIVYDITQDREVGDILNEI